MNYVQNGGSRAQTVRDASVTTIERKLSQMRGLLLEPEKLKISEYEYTTCADIEKAINSPFAFSVVYRHIGTIDSPLYIIYLDDVGKLITPQYVSAFNADDSSKLVGNLLISRTSEYGGDLGLTDDDIELIKQATVTMYDYGTGIKTLGLFPIYYPMKRQ